MGQGIKKKKKKKKKKLSPNVFVFTQRVTKVLVPKQIRYSFSIILQSFFVYLVEYRIASNLRRYHNIALRFANTDVAS